jgi:hypothetical protein
MDKEKTYNQWYWKLYRWFKWDAKYIHKTVYKGIKNLIQWFPIIWKDRDWDNSFIYDLLEFKLRRQSKYTQKIDKFTSSQQSARNMRICADLISRIKDDYYSIEYIDYTEDDFWFEPLDEEDETGEKLFEIKSTNITENYDEYFKKYPLVYKRVLKGEGPVDREGREDNKLLIAMNIGYLNQERARKLLFKIMEQNIERWWL